MVWTDADMSYPNPDIPRLVKELDGYDQVVGARRTEQGSMKVIRIPAKWSIRKLAAYLVDQPITDLNSGFRAFRRDVAEQFLHVLPAGFSCVSTMTLSFLANGYSVKYVDIDYQPRAGHSKFHPWRDTKSYVTQVVRMVLSYNPLRIFMPIALAARRGRSREARLRLDDARLRARDEHVARAARRAADPRVGTRGRPRGARHPPEAARRSGRAHARLTRGARPRAVSVWTGPRDRWLAVAPVATRGSAR